MVNYYLTILVFGQSPPNNFCQGIFFVNSYSNWELTLKNIQGSSFFVILFSYDMGATERTLT